MTPVSEAELAVAGDLLLAHYGPVVRRHECRVCGAVKVVPFLARECEARDIRS